MPHVQAVFSVVKESFTIGTGMVGSIIVNNELHTTLFHKYSAQY